MATYRALLSLNSSLDDPDSRLSALSALRLLNLSNNVFNRTFPPELSNLTNLRVLDRPLQQQPPHRRVAGFVLRRHQQSEFDQPHPTTVPQFRSISNFQFSATSPPRTTTPAKKSKRSGGVLLQDERQMRGLRDALDYGDLFD
ncbi:hypothetical protein ACLB2K_053431 [Fragaria x ananassa]